MWPRELSRSGALAGWPILLAQGLRVRRTTLRLPEAEGLVGQVGVGEHPLRLLVLGDSVAAGVGVGHHADTFAGRLAGRLAARSGRPVTWTVIACSGHTAGEARTHLQGRPELAAADFVVLSIGVNDTVSLHSDQRWRTELTALVSHVVTTAAGVPVVVLAMPPMDVFPALPRALAGLMGARARRLDRIGREVLAQFPGVRRMEMGELDAVSAFAEDGFHPSAATHDLFAARIDLLLGDEPRSSVGGSAAQ